MLRLFVNVPESFGPFLQPGLTADVTVPQFPNRHFTAKFLTVARGFDVSTRTAVTEFTIDNEDRALWPGSYATVRLTAPIERTVLTIPSTAMVFQEHGTQVAVVTEDDRVHFKSIAVTKILDNAIEVTEGISTSDRIINNPSAALLEGDKVRIVTPAPGYHIEVVPSVKDTDHKGPWRNDRRALPSRADMSHTGRAAALCAASCCWRSPCLLVVGSRQSIWPPRILHLNMSSLPHGMGRVPLWRRRRPMANSVRIGGNCMTIRC